MIRRGLIAALLALALVAPGRAAAEETRVSFVHRPQPICRQGEAVVIEGHMLGASEVESALLFFKSGSDTTWERAELELVAGDHYRGEIPGASVNPPKLFYYVVAIDFLESEHSALGSASAPIEVEVEETAAPPPSPVEPSARPPTPEPGPGPKPPPGPAVAAPRPPGAGSTPAAAAPPEKRVFEAPRALDLADRDAGLVTRIERDEIATLGARTLVDVLERIPELDVRRDVAGFFRIALRGLRANGDVVVLLDGTVLNDPYDGGTLLALPAAVIDRVELRRGLATGLDGPVALAGTIHVFTRDATGFNAAVSGGSFVSQSSSAEAMRTGTYLGSVRGGVAGEKVRWSAAAGLWLTDGTQAEIGRDGYSSAPHSSETPGPIKDGSLNLAAATTLTLSHLLPGSLSLGARYLHEQRDGWIGRVDAYGPDSAHAWHVGMMQIGHELLVADRHQILSRVGVTLGRTDRRYQLAPRGFRLSDRNGDGAAEVFDSGVLEEVRVDSLRVDAESRAALKLAQTHTLFVGARVDWAAVGEPALARNLDVDGVAGDLASVEAPPALISGLTRFAATVHTEDDWAVHEKVRLAMGFRFAYVGNVDGFEPEKLFNLRFGLSYRPVSAARIRLLYGSTLRPPTLAERADQAAVTLPAGLREDRFVGNPGLDLAAQHLVELGLDLQGLVAGLEYSCRAGTYYARSIDAIEAVFGADAVDAATGVTRVSARHAIDHVGVVVDGRLDVGERTYLYASSWWQRVFDREPEGYTLLTATPQVGALFGVHVLLPSLGDIDLFGRYAAERRNDTRTVIERLRSFSLPAELVVHAALRSRPLWTRLRLGLSLHNAFDTARRDEVPRPDLMPGALPGEGFQVLGHVEVELP